VQVGVDRVTVAGGKGHPKTKMLKVSVGYEGLYVGEGQISYAGPGAVERGQLALDIVRARLEPKLATYAGLRTELIGVDSILGKTGDYTPSEVRVRVVGQSSSERDAGCIASEVEALYLNGPAGGGGVTTTVRQQLSIASAMIPEALVKTSFEMLQV
jgi:hypothetical protein